MKDVALKPKVSEKAYGLSQTKRVYIFSVPQNLSKQAIAQAVQAQFGVTVEAVNTAISKGKPKRTVRKSGRPIYGRRATVKNAYVTVKEGDQIPVFAAIEAAEKETEQAAKKKEKK